MLIKFQKSVLILFLFSVFIGCKPENREAKLYTSWPLDNIWKRYGLSGLLQPLAESFKEAREDKGKYIGALWEKADRETYNNLKNSIGNLVSGYSNYMMEEHDSDDFIACLIYYEYKGSLYELELDFYKLNYDDMAQGDMVLVVGQN